MADAGAKIGKLIAKLRKEKGLTQKNVADALGIRNKAVSQRKCGLGFPDLSYWPELSAILGGDMVLLHRLYPEQSPSLRIPIMGGGSLYLYRNQRGLSAYQKLL